MSGMRFGADSIVDVGSQQPALSGYVLQQGAGGAAVLSGFFVDEMGIQIVTGGVYTYSWAISTTAKTLKELLTTNLPPAAVGFKGRLTVDVIYSTGAVDLATPAALAADMAAAANMLRYPFLSAGDDIVLGRG